MPSEPAPHADLKKTRLVFAAAGGVATAMLIGLIAMFSSAWSIWNDAPSSARVAREPPRHAAPPPIDMLQTPLSRSVTASRLVESIDPRRQFARVRAARTRVTIAVNQVQQSFWSGTTIATRRRDVIGYLVGRPPRTEGTSILVPRCGLSFIEARSAMPDSFLNAALVVDTDSLAIPLRFAPSASLLGTGVRNILLENGAVAPDYVARNYEGRYFTDLEATGRQLTLASGIGVPAVDAKIAILSIASADPALGRLGSSRFLRMVDVAQPLRVAYDALVAHESTFADRLQRDLDAACANAAPSPNRGPLDVLIAVATVQYLANAVDSDLGEDARVALTRQLDSLVRNADSHDGEVVRTVIEHIEGPEVVDVRFEDAMLLIELRNTGATETWRVAVAGVSNAGLSDDDSRRVLDAVRSFLGHGDVWAAVGSSEGDPDDHACVQPMVCRGTFIARSAHIDLAAELLERGLVRVRTDDARLVRAQPSLVAAANHGLDNKSAGAVTADEAYRQSIQRLEGAAHDAGN